MYKHVVWDFSDKEIDQIVGLTRAYSAGGWAPIDRRSYTRQVIDWALRRGMLIDGAKIERWDYGSAERKRPHWAKAGRLHFTDSLDSSVVPMGIFDPVWDLPREALWRVVAPMLEKSQGYMLSLDRRWQELLTWQRGAQLHDRKQADRIYKVMGTLDLWGYVIFQHAGSIWQVTITADRAMRSD